MNKRLSHPLHFEKEFLSFQKVRNCLEHRAGIVTPVDADASGNLVLSLPRLIISYVKVGKEIEVRQGERIEGEEGKGAQISLRMGTGSREFKLSERMRFVRTSSRRSAWAVGRLPMTLAKNCQGPKLRALPRLPSHKFLGLWAYGVMGVSSPSPPGTD